MKKTVLLLLLCLTLVSLVGCKNTELSENPESDFEYEVNPAGSGIIITKYVGTSDRVVIPKTIEGLPVCAVECSRDKETDALLGAFEGSKIKSVVIPDSVLAIGSNTFADCTELTQVSFGEASVLHTVGHRTFYGCTSLKEIKLSDSVKTIDKLAFYGCSSLTELDLPENLEKIEEEAFGNCTSLKTVTVPQKLNLKNYLSIPFSGCVNLEKIVFEEGREDIIGYAFFDTRAYVEIMIPKSVMRLAPETFFIYGGAKIVFSGDCPELASLVGDDPQFYGDPAIYYDPNTKGWDNCSWKGIDSLNPIE